MPEIFRHRGGTLSLSRTHIMGILNVTPDSFSDGGAYFRPQDAVERALQIEAEGASILDIGAQSTRPGHAPVSADEEWARLQPVLQAVRPRVKIPISLDTCSPVVALRALKMNAADILNDVSGSLENGFVELARRTGAGLVMMHTGTGGETLSDIRAYFEAAVAAATAEELPLECVCLDPGVGFGKTREVDAQIPFALGRLTGGLPAAVLVGASRKRVIAACGGGETPADRTAGTLAYHTVCQLHGARILRVHDVAAAVRAAAVTDALMLSASPAQ